MTATPAETPIISLRKGFGALVVKGPDIEVEIREDGKVVVRSGVVETVSATPSLSNTASLAAPEVGNVMPEGHKHAGWIYGGISNTTGRPFYIAPKDSGVMQWHEAMDYAARNGVSLPSRAELNQMYDARNEGALKGTFNATGSDSAGWYWSSWQTDGYYVWALRFGGGVSKVCGGKDGASSLRCVRS